MDNELVQSLKRCINEAKKQVFGERVEIVEKICQDDFTCKKIYANIRGLFYFALRHKELKGEEIEAFVRENANTFKILHNFIQYHSNAVNELRVLGTKDMTIGYLRAIRLNKKSENKKAP